MLRLSVMLSGVLIVKVAILQSDWSWLNFYELEKIINIQVIKMTIQFLKVTVTVTFISRKSSI